MKRRVVVLNCVLLAILIVGMWVRWGGSDLGREGQDGDAVLVPKADEKQIATDEVMPLEVEGPVDNSGNDFFDATRRAVGGSDYARRYRRHQNIQQYLASPYRDEPGYQNLLRELYANGYGLEHWSQAGAAIVTAQLRLPIHTSVLRQRGYTYSMMVDEIKSQRKKWSDEQTTAAVEQMVQYSGITDEGLIDRLLDIPLFFENGSNPFGVGAAVRPVNGEKFLSDPDWMPESISEIVARRTEPEIQLPDDEARLYNFRLWKAGLLTPETRIENSRVYTEEGLIVRTNPFGPVLGNPELQPVEGDKRELQTIGP